jgi:hypothetical protein
MLSPALLRAPLEHIELRVPVSHAYLVTSVKTPFKLHAQRDVMVIPLPKSLPPAMARATLDFTVVLVPLLLANMCVEILHLCTAQMV